MKYYRKRQDLFENKAGSMAVIKDTPKGQNMSFSILSKDMLENSFCEGAEKC